MLSLGSYEREVLASLLFVMVLATSSCGDQDASPTTGSRDRQDVASAPTVEPDEKPAGEQSPSEPESPVTGPTRARIMRRLDGRRIRVGRRIVTIDGGTLACGRAGTANTGGQRRIRLRCVQPTFWAGSVAGPDAIFLVHLTRAGRFVITNARLTSY